MLVARGVESSLPQSLTLLPWGGGRRGAVRWPEGPAQRRGPNLFMRHQHRAGSVLQGGRVYDSDNGTTCHQVLHSCAPQRPSLLIGLRTVPPTVISTPDEDFVSSFPFPSMQCTRTYINNGLVSALVAYPAFDPSRPVRFEDTCHGTGCRVCCSSNGGTHIKFIGRILQMKVPLVQVT